MVGEKSIRDPEKARKLLLTGYWLQEKRLQLFPDRKLPASGQYVARVVMQNIIKAIYDETNNQWHDRSRFTGS